MTQLTLSDGDRFPLEENECGHHLLSISSIIWLEITWRAVTPRTYQISVSSFGRLYNHSLFLSLKQMTPRSGALPSLCALSAHWPTVYLSSVCLPLTTDACWCKPSWHFTNDCDRQFNIWQIRVSLCLFASGISTHTVEKDLFFF